MILSYGVTLTGKSHISRNTCCQDAHKIEIMKNGWVIAAVADGVGSAENSAVGSQIAVDTIVDFCEKYMPYDYNLISIKSMLRTGYNYAFTTIVNEAEKEGNAIESYDTTLTIVIYDGTRIIFGHSGDGSIIGLTAFGNYVTITSPQKGEDQISVIPLRAGYSHWVIDTYEDNLSAVMLMTDGMLNVMTPYLLKLQDKDESTEIYVPLAMFFSDPNCFNYSDEVSGKNEAEISKFVEAKDDMDAHVFYDRIINTLKKYIGVQDREEKIAEIYKNNFAIKLMTNEQDDKTIVGLINMEKLPEAQRPNYYTEPNWNKLQEHWNRLAYPHLYSDIGTGTSDSNSAIVDSNEQSGSNIIDNEYDILYDDEESRTEFRKYESTNKIHKPLSDSSYSNSESKIPIFWGIQPQLNTLQQDQSFQNSNNPLQSHQKVPPDNNMGIREPKNLQTDKLNESAQNDNRKTNNSILDNLKNRLKDISNHEDKKNL